MHEEDRTTETIASIIYIIWIARNKHCFEKNNIHVVVSARKALSTLNEYQAGMEISEVNHEKKQKSKRDSVRWKPPQINEVKINVDAALTVDGCWGIGVVCRDDSVSVLAATACVITRSEDVATAEAMAMKTGISFAIDCCFKSVAFESDSLSLISALNAASHFGPMAGNGNGGPASISGGYVGSLVTTCKKLSAHLDKASFSHVFRESNLCAHLLAKFALDNPNLTWMEKTPSCIFQACMYDSLTLIQ